MKKCKYDDFPISTVLIRAAIALALLGSGGVIMYQTDLWLGIAYDIYVVGLLLIILKTACTRCDYYGARCDTGLSKIATLLFSRNKNRERFPCIAKRSLLPLAVLVIAPITVFVVEAISAVSLFSVISISVFLVSMGLLVWTNRTLSCPHCKMSDICPVARAKDQG